MQNKKLKEKDILYTRGDFVERARKYAEIVAAGKQIPPDVHLKEKEAFLVQYRKQLEAVEKAKRASLERFDEEIRQLKNSIEHIEMEIITERKRTQRKG